MHPYAWCVQMVQCDTSTVYMIHAARMHMGTLSETSTHIGYISWRNTTGARRPGWRWGVPDTVAATAGNASILPALSRWHFSTTGLPPFRRSRPLRRSLCVCTAQDILQPYLRIHRTVVIRFASSRCDFYLPKAGCVSPGFVCLFVCLSVGNFCIKLPIEFSWNFGQESHLDLDQTWVNNSGKISIKLHLQLHIKLNPP